MTPPASDNVASADAYVVLPFYLVCDVSYSMVDHIPTLNAALHDFRDQLAKDPVLSDKARFGVVDFSDNARIVVPLSDFAEEPLPDSPLNARGGTSYAAAFRLLRSTIEQDAARLKADGMRVFRPAAFFLTDGAPNPGDGWVAAFHDLTHYDPESGQGFQAYPLFVPFGIGDADGDLLARLVHPPNRSKLFMARDGASAASAIQAMLAAMLQSVLASGRSATAGKPMHVLPTPNSPDIDEYVGGNLLP